jgi:hypothetical protein
LVTPSGGHAIAAWRGVVLGYARMRKYELYWYGREGEREVLLTKEEMRAADRESAKRKALALFGDGGAVLGAHRIKLQEDGAMVWQYP